MTNASYRLAGGSKVLPETGKLRPHVKGAFSAGNLAADYGLKGLASPAYTAVQAGKGVVSQVLLPAFLRRGVRS
jgi:hypothetical protein